MAKYVLRSDTQIGTVKIDGDYTAESVLNMMQQNEPNAKWTECEILPRGKHICKYCGNIAEGTLADLLCSDCRETFGHTMHSEL